MSNSKKLLVFLFVVLLIAGGTALAWQNKDRLVGKKCGIESCHGLEIQCGPNVPDVCTMMYELGDNCRKFAKCEVVERECQLTESPDFDQCKACVTQCIEEFEDDSVKAFECEAGCTK